jgi:hypothetical protein
MEQNVTADALKGLDNTLLWQSNFVELLEPYAIAHLTCSNYIIEILHKVPLQPEILASSDKPFIHTLITIIQAFIGQGILFEGLATTFGQDVNFCRVMCYFF